MMRNTNRWLRLNGLLLMSICVLMLMVVLGGCESTGAGGSDTDGTEASLSPGEALVLPEENITDWSLGTRDDVVVILVDTNADPVKGYGPVTVQDNGDFPGMSIDPPPQEALLSWADFREVYDNTVYDQALNTFSVNITDDTVRFQSFYYLEVQNTGDLIVRVSGSGAAEVSWIYADGPTRISATFNTGDYDVTIDLQLVAGWNLAVMKSDDINKILTLKTEAEPAGIEWYLY